MNKINKFFSNNLNSIIIIFLLLSPFFDLLTSVFINVFKLEFNFIIIIKMLMLFILFYCYFISDGKKNKFLNLSIFSIIIYMIIFGVDIFIYKGLNSFLYEFSNTVKTFFFPLTLIIMYHMYSNKKLKISHNILVFVLLEYLILLLIPIVTNQGFNSYAHSKVGTIGWFNSTNEIGAIISILLPILFYKIIKANNKFIFILTLIIISYIYMTIGSKTPTLALIILFIVLIILYMCKCFVKKKYKGLILMFLISIVGVGLLIDFVPKTSFYKNIIIHLNFLGIDNISDLADVHNIDHFIFSERIKFMGRTSNNYFSAPLFNKLIGIGYIENYGTDNTNLKMIEMDYYDIFFRHGIIGFIIFFAPVIYIIIKEVKNFNKYSSQYVLYDLSILLTILLALFTGHVLISPSVSFIVVILFLNWFEVHKNKSKKLLFTAYDLNLGGIETALINLLNRMDYDKYDITLVLEKKEGIFLNQINDKVLIKEHKVYNNKNVLVRKFLNLINKIKFMILNYKEYDFSCCYATYSLSGNLLTRIASSNSVIYIHNNYYYLYDKDISKVKGFFDVRHLNSFKKIIFVSNESLKDFLNIYPQYKTKSLVINNFVNNELIVEKSKEKIKERKSSKNLFVAVGRLDEHQKRISRLIKLFKNLEDEDIELWIIGDGPDREKYELEIKNNNISNIKLLGKKSNPYPYIKKADYIILTSDYEGFPVVYMEAITLNKPIITTVNVSDDYINIDKKYGVIISKDENKMTKQVREIITSGFAPSKLDYQKMNKDKMNRIEQIIEGE